MGGAERLVGLRAGFTLIGLVVTLTIMATVSGVAGFYYMQVLEDRKTSVARNELDALAKQVHGYLIRHGYQPLSTTTFDFLAKDGTWPENGNILDGRLQILDPWGHEYGIDPVAAVVFSPGLDEVSGDDDIRIPYSRTIDIEGAKPRSFSEDTVPPIILKNSPTGVIRINDPVVQASFIDHFGGTIDPNSIKLWIDGTLMTPAMGVTSSAGQVLFTSAGIYSEEEHRVVVQVQDGAGNVGRREWRFIVDTIAADIKITSPSQGRMIHGLFDIGWSITENQPKSWKLLWDSFTINGDSAPAPLVGYTNSKQVDPSGDAQIPPELLKDGLHHITLKLEDTAGRVYSDQVEVILDNTAPKVWITRNPPNSTGTPLKITTNIPQFRGWADDQGGMIKTVEYWYRKAPSDAWVFTLPTAEETAPRTACPVDYKGNPPNNSMALFNSASEEWSTTAVNPLHYEATTVPTDQLYLRVRATDLAGNQSTIEVTEFIVDPYGGGIFNEKFTDATWTGFEVYKPHRTITGLASSAVGASYWPSMVQTSGSVSFTCAESQAASWWEVVIDDYSIPAPHERADAVLTKWPSVPHDWYSTGPNTASTAAARVSDLYWPHGTNKGSTCVVRRGAGACNPLQEGAYIANIAYYGVLYNGVPGPPRSAITTFFVDNTLPLAFGVGDVVFRDSAGVARNVTDPYFITGWSKDAAPYQLHFGGTARDVAPGEIARVWWGWDLVNPLLAPNQAGSAYKRCYPCPPHGAHDGTFGSQPAASVVSYGICADVVTQNSMRRTTTDRFGLEGTHKLYVVSEDSAGLTRCTSRTIVVNCVGAVVEVVRLKNTVPPSNVTYTTTSAMRIIPEKRVDLSFRVSDEAPLSGARYRIYPIQVPSVIPGGGTFIGPTGYVMDSPTTDLILTKDSLGNDFKSGPVSYALDIWGETGGIPGDILRTRITFNALGSLAIVAPHFSAGATHPTSPEHRIRLLGWREQTAVARYLYENVRSFSTKAIYDYTGQVAGGFASGYVGPPPTIFDWLSMNTANKSTDVLVVLDQGLKSMYDPTDWVKRFYWADKDGAGGTDSTTPENDVIVWMGPYPSSSHIDTNRDQTWIYGDARDDQTKGFSNLMGFSISADWQFSMFSRDEPLPDFQKIRPDPVNAPHADVYLPSLTSHNIGVFPNIDRLMMQPYRDQEGENHDGSRVERLFTVDTINLGANDTDSGNFVYRRDVSKCRFAFFFTYGRDTDISDKWIAQEGSNTPKPRSPILPAPYVIQEFIDNWLTNQGGSPVNVTKRIVYAADDSHLSQASPAGAGANDDVYFTPSSSGGWTNVIPADDPGDDEVLVQGITGNANTIVFTGYRIPEAGDTGASAGRSLYKWEGGSVTRIFLADKVNNPIPASEGVGVADNGHVVFNTKNKGAPTPTAEWASNVIYHYTGSGDPVRITTGEGTDVTDSLNPYISKNGQYITFASQTIYGQYATELGGVDNRAPGYINPKATAERQVVRYSYIPSYIPDAIPSNRFTFGWVTRNLRPHDDYRSSTPKITNDGKAVVFRCAYMPSTQDHEHLMFAVLEGAGWWWGRLTAGDDADDVEVKAFTITPQPVRPGDSLPWIAFMSYGDYDGLRPDGAAPWVSWPASSTTSDNCEGAAATSVGVGKIYLCTNVAEPFIPLVKLNGTGGNHELGRLDFSQDGREIAFSTDTDKVHFLVAWNGSTPVYATFPPAGETMSNNRWRTYRLRLGFDVSGGSLRQPITATVTMAVPDKTSDYSDRCKNVFISK